MVSSAQILGRIRLSASRYGLAAVVVGAALLAGCGQKGALFLPVPPKVPPAPTATTPPSVTPALPASAAR
ncbi:LPS translocon maturation chaperone LptM [Polaromonas aquatica]|uniref:LPS translocon maturation chaperone LptM n=1 Tax=Polaromonas aquatica TaxID=332657 RepID=UPI003D65C76C